jgi:hypothetical protein
LQARVPGALATIDAFTNAAVQPDTI